MAYGDTEREASGRMSPRVATGPAEHTGACCCLGRNSTRARAGLGEEQSGTGDDFRSGSIRPLPASPRQHPHSSELVSRLRVFFNGPETASMGIGDSVCASQEGPTWPKVLLLAKGRDRHWPRPMRCSAPWKPEVVHEPRRPTLQLAPAFRACWGRTWACAQGPPHGDHRLDSELRHPPAG